MKVFLFDFLPYGQNLDHLKVDGKMPKPLGKRHFDPAVQIRTYEEHLAGWEEMEKCGFDGVGFNEHHGTPYGTMNSPNLIAAALSQRTKKMKILILGNLLPIHEPLRLAEEIAMLDNLTGGRIICGVARGIPREYRYFNIPLAESRARFDECFEVMRKSWTEESFSHEGKFFSFKDIACWPRPVQQPHPLVWVPISGSKESIEWAARVNAAITPSSWLSLEAKGVQEEIVRYYAECQAREGRKVTSDMISIQLNCYVADSKAKAIEECGPYFQYLHNTLVRFDQPEMGALTNSGYAGQGFRNMARAPEGASGWRGPIFGGLTREQLVERADELAWGTPDEVAAHIIRQAEETGAGTALLLCNPGAMPQEMFLNQIRRIGAEVLPRLHAHKMARIPPAEGIVL
jgi:alkanesulfonate monooxygenase SsuD/methylene tetrahydromethanopterin reductase-like flavin-dependent oxidoreductase (luciferase family)